MRKQATRENPQGYIYVVDFGGGVFKIGRTINPPECLNRLCAPQGFYWICLVKNCIDAEFHLLNKFFAKRVNKAPFGPREKFYLDKKDIEYIKQREWEKYITPKNVPVLQENHFISNFRASILLRQRAAHLERIP